jgi:hypothetical protein
VSQTDEAAGQPQLTKEQKVAQINAFRDAIYKSAVDNNLNFDVVFNALAQTASMLLFDFLLLTKGELNGEDVSAAVERFNSQLSNTAKVGLENMQAAAQARAAEEPKEV